MRRLIIYFTSPASSRRRPQPLPGRLKRARLPDRRPIRSPEARSAISSASSDVLGYTTTPRRDVVLRPAQPIRRRQRSPLLLASAIPLTRCARRSTCGDLRQYLPRTAISPYDFGNDSPQHHRRQPEQRAGQPCGLLPLGAQLQAARRMSSAWVRTVSTTPAPNTPTSLGP